MKKETISMIVAALLFVGVLYSMYVVIEKPEWAYEKRRVEIVQGGYKSCAVQYRAWDGQWYLHKFTICPEHIKVLPNNP